MLGYLAGRRDCGECERGRGGGRGSRLRGKEGEGLLVGA